jgi:hypothetical protein
MTRKVPGTLRFGLVIAYETPELGMRGLRLAERLGKQLGTEYDVSVALWSFDRIGRQNAEEAADTCLRANMIILAAGGDAELPGPICTWLEGWAGRGTSEPLALVAVHNLDERAPFSDSRLWQYLRALAVRGSLDFFWYGAPATSLEIIGPAPEDSRSNAPASDEGLVAI